MPDEDGQLEDKSEDDELEELAEEFYDDPDGVLEKLDEKGLDIDDLPL